jgi:hypothetical protein
MGTGFIWWLLPDQALPVVFGAGCLILVLGFWRAGLGLMIPVLLMPVVSPIVERTMAKLPPWAALALLALAGLSLLRGLASLVLGRSAANLLLAALALGFVRLILLVLVVAPLRLAHAVFAASFRGLMTTSRTPGGFPARGKVSRNSGVARTRSRSRKW